MMNSLNRRGFLKSSVAAGAALGCPMQAYSAEPLNIAMVLPSPVGDVGWSHTLVLGTEAIKAEYGDLAGAIGAACFAMDRLSP